MANASTDSIDWAKLKKFLLTCPVCLSSFDDKDRKAKHLPECQHSVCEQCIKNILRQQTEETNIFPCPECRTPTALPEGGVAQFKSSLHIERLRNYAPTGSLPQTTHACQSCCDSAPAEGWCDSGCGYLCRVCFKAHRQKMRLVEDHSFQGLTPELEAQLQKLHTQRMCGVHKQEYTQVCQTCDELACDACASSIHTKDKGHQCCNLTTVAERDKEELDRLVDGALAKQKEIMDLLKVINKNQASWKGKMEQAKHDSKKFYEKCQKQLEDYYRLVTWSIESAHKRVQKQIQGKKEQAQLSLMKMGTCSEYVTGLFETGSSLDIVRARKDVGPTMQEIAETDFNANLYQSGENILRFLSKESDSLVSGHLTALGQVVDMVVQTVTTKGLLVVGSKCIVRFSVSNSVGILRVADTECFGIELQDPNQNKVKCEVECEQQSIHAITLSVSFTPHHSGQYTVKFIHSCYVDKVFYEYAVDVAGCKVTVVNSTIKEVKAKLVISGTDRFPLTDLIRAILIGPVQGADDNAIEGVVEFDTRTKEYTITANPNSTGDHVLKIYIGDMEMQKVFWVTEGKLYAEAGLCVCNRPCCVVLRGSVPLDSVDITVVEPSGKQIAWKKVNAVSQEDETKNWIRFTPMSRGDYHLIVRDKVTQGLHCHIAIQCCLLNVVISTQTVLVGGVCHAVINAENIHGEQIELPHNIITSAMNTPSIEGAVCVARSDTKNERSFVPVKAFLDPDNKKSLRIQFIPQSEGKHTILMLTKLWGPTHDAVHQVHAQKSEDFGPNRLNHDGFQQPSDMTIGRNGLIHVTDTKINSCVKSLNQAGKCVGKWPLPIKGKAVCVCDADNFLHVMYPNQRKLYKMSPNGDCSECALPDNVKHPVDITINPEGHLLVLDKTGLYELKCNQSNNQCIQVHRLEKKWANCGQICIDGKGLMYVSEVDRGVTIVDNFFGKFKGHYPIRNDLTVGGIALSSDDQYLLIMTQDKRHKYDFLYVFNTTTHKQHIIRIGHAYTGVGSPNMDRLVILNDGYMLRLEGECNRIRKYGYICQNIPWS